MFRLGLCLLLAGLPIKAQLPDEPSCPRCIIAMSTVAKLGTDDGPGSLNGRPMSVNLDARGRYWVFQELEPPAVFSASGAFLQSVGRKGAGPAEFQAADYGAVIGDSMLVFDWLSSRATVVGGDLKAVRSIGYRPHLSPAVVLSWPGLLVMNGFAPATSPANSALHRVTFADREMAILGSFGPVGTGGSMGSVLVSQTLALASGSRVWSADRVRYHIARWKADGTADASFERKPEWFTGEVSGARAAAELAGLAGDPRTTPPKPRTTALKEDADGLVWVFISVAAPTWRDAWPKVAAGTKEVRSRDIAWDKMYRTMIEVIDPTQARVVARRALDSYVFAALPGGRAAIYTIDENGIPRVSVVSLSLSGR